MLDRTAISELWTDALAKPGATQLRALSEVLGDDISIAGQRGKTAVLEWIKTWPGKSMIRTGTWAAPCVDGDTVTIVCDFDARAAYYNGTLALTINGAGVTTASTLRVNAAPPPLGDVINRVWGPRAGLDRLSAHLADSYGVTVKKVTTLDNGVLRVDRAHGAPWVVRVFPSDRPLGEVRGDAAVLSYLEEQNYPAERVADEVSSLEDQGVLVTDFVTGRTAAQTRPNATAMADLLGRLHAIKGGPTAVKRAAGGLHLYSADTTVRSEIATARECLLVGAFRGTDRWYGELLEALEKADDFSALPSALSHPDFHFKNTIATKDGLVPIDWAGAGRAPRVLALAMLLFYGSLVPQGWDPKRVEAMVDAYSAHIAPTRSELDRLAEAIQHRMLIHETYSWCVSMARQRKSGSRKDWPGNARTAEAIADHVRSRL